MHCESSSKLGGVGFYIKKGITYKLKRNINLDVANVEDLWIEVRIKTGPAAIGVIYRHPSNLINSDELFPFSLCDIFCQFNAEKMPFYALGDYNINLMRANASNSVKNHVHYTINSSCKYTYLIYVTREWPLIPKLFLTIFTAVIIIVGMFIQVGRGGQKYFTCDSACAAIIFKRLSWSLRRKYFSNFEGNRASAIQIRLGRIVFQSNVIKVKKKHLRDRLQRRNQDFWLAGKAKPQITRNDVIKIFRKEGLFMEQRYRRMEDQKPRPGLAFNLNFAKEKGLEPKVKKISRPV